MLHPLISFKLLSSLRACSSSWWSLWPVALLTERKPLSSTSQRNKTNKPSSWGAWQWAGAPGRGSSASLPPTWRLCALITSLTASHYLVMCCLTLPWEVFRGTKMMGQNTFAATTFYKPACPHSETFSLCVRHTSEPDSPLMVPHASDTL